MARSFVANFAMWRRVWITLVSGNCELTENQPMKAKGIAMVLLAALFSQGAAGYTPVKDGVVVRTANGDVRLKVINDKIIRVSATPNDSFPDDASLVVLPVTATPVYTVSTSGDNVNIATSEIKAVVSEKTGAVTFFGDLFKAIIAVLIFYFIYRNTYPQAVKCIELYAGFGAVLGHNFPFFLNFKGGKGIACTSGVILAVCPIAAPICLVLFILAVAITRYVSLGSILVVISFLIQAIVFNHMGLLGVSGNYAVEFDILAACFTAMAIWRHRANIKRLLSGTENKFGQKAK